MDKKLEKILEKFKEEMKKELGEALHSIILYGSASRADFVPKRSDVNVLVVLNKIDRTLLAKIGKLMKRYRGYRFATPVVVDKDYIERSLDVFPMEFQEIQRNHKIIYGENLISGLKIAKEALRLQLERELKQSLLWLRELLIEYPKINRGLTNALMNLSRAIATQIRALSSLVSCSTENTLSIIASLGQKIGARLDSIGWLVSLRVKPKAPKKAEIQKQLSNLLEELNLLVQWIDEMMGK